MGWKPKPKGKVKGWLGGLLSKIADLFIKGRQAGLWSEKDGPQFRGKNRISRRGPR